MNSQPSRRRSEQVLASVVGEQEATRSNRIETRESLIREIASWKEVSVHQHRFGGVEFRVGRRELGHLHAAFADLPFPHRVRDELIAAGRARPHHVLPDSGWVTVPMRKAEEFANVTELFRRNYQRAIKVRR